MGSLSILSSSIFLIALSAAGKMLTPVRTVNFPGNYLYFSLMERLTSYRGLKFDFCVSVSFTTFSASSIPPSEPFEKTSEKATSTFKALHLFLTYSISASESVSKWLMATRSGTWNFLMFSICFSRLTILFQVPEGSQFPDSLFHTAVILKSPYGGHQHDQIRL